ncbi:MAG: oligosaccharyl transferase, archaeosortase A system-associated, partial [Methanosarcinales archaeon]|nr:oligosaccharyl transferase, archaeosortase A system-associated [Methanosarcinales archaeon]
KGRKVSKKEIAEPEHSLPQQTRQPAETKQPLIERLKSSAPYGTLLTIIFAMALYIRAVLPYDSVFLDDGTIRFGGNDPWYHMRIVEYILHNYPHTLTYDAFTEFPHGHLQHYGPLYDHAIAFISLVLGLGNPDMHLAGTVGAYFPPVLGALVVIPVYFIGKHLHNRGTGLLAALIIATLPGQFLSRSLLGFVDHHVAETLFSTATILFIMLALRSARAQDLSFSNLNSGGWRAVKDPLIYAILAGVAYATYQLCWTGALMFGMLIMIAAAAIYIAEHIRGNSTEYITIIGVITFGLELLLIVPCVHLQSGFSGNYSLLHVVAPVVAIIALVVMYAVSREMNRRNTNPYYYPLALLLIVIIGIGLLNVASPQLGSSVKSNLAIPFVLREGGPATVAETSSMLYDRSGNFNIGRNSMVYGNFGNCFYISLLGILFLSYYVIRRWKPEDILALIWTIVMLLAIYGQNRFGYYYAVNVALMSAYFSTRIIELAGFKSIRTTIEDLPQYLTKNAGYILLAILLVAILVYPWGPAPLALKQAKYSGGPNTPWYNSLEWMQDNTPDTGLSYHGPYVRPPPGEPYPYPDTAYGVMSWWDYGFWIENIARRIPNANPFQGGIGGGEAQRPGASTFFTAESEAEANEIADTLGVKYVVSDVEMATGKFYAITAWDGDTGGYSEWLPIGDRMEMVPTMRYFNSMEGRLHIFDGVSLKHYRLVHESMAGNTAERGYKWVYNMQPMLYPDLFENRQQDLPAEIAEADTGYVKIFEYVKGAKITGTAPPNSTATLSIPILTNQGRTFEYVQTVTATPDGTATLIAPYSTDGPISIDDGGTQFDTAPTGMYTVTIAGISHQVSVAEDDVLAGNTIEVT